MLDRYIAEATQCDFKQELEVKKPKSWLKSVCAFANGIGGRLLFGVDDSGKPVGLEDIRESADKISELIADLFHRMRFMERRGSGLGRIVAETEKLPGYEESMRPQFRSDAVSFTVVLRNVNYATDSTNSTINSTNSTPENALLEALLENISSPSFSIARFAKDKGCSASAVRYALNRLRTAGKIARTGSTRSGKWILLPQEEH